MKIGIMQPYFSPYLGYFQLMDAVDQIVIYDNIEFTKKGWIHRNRYLKNGSDDLFSLPLKKDSDYLDINQRVLADNYLMENKKTLRKLEASYKKAPYYSYIFPYIESIFLFNQHNNLFEYIFNSLLIFKNLLNIDTEVLISSQIKGDSRGLKGKDRVINTCKVLGGNNYINPIGGVSLYEKNEFSSSGINLEFIQMLPIEYKQFSHDFVPSLSIIDVLMFNHIDSVQSFLKQYKLK